MSLAALLAERARRQAELDRINQKRAEEEAQASALTKDVETTDEAMARYAAIAAQLRAPFHPKQAAFFASKHRQRFLLKTRRAGATWGGCRDTIAHCFETRRYRALYVNEIREEAEGLAWRSDTQGGVIDVLEQLAEQNQIRLGKSHKDLKAGADVVYNEQKLTVTWRNGAQFRIFAADDKRSQERGRGGAKHRVWVDEAQKYMLLRMLVEEVMGAGMADFEGEFLLTGTPAELLEGYFYDVSRDDDLALRAPGWEGHFFTVLDNPRFGATEADRFARVIRPVILAKKPQTSALTDEQFIAEFLASPPAWFQREWQGKWVKSDAQYVYSVHRWPAPATFAPLRTTSVLLPPFLAKLNPEGKDPSGVSGWTDRWYDHAASVRDLPKTLPDSEKRLDWFYGAGFDFGYNPDPFAIKLWAWSPQMPAYLWSMFSWKRTLVLPDYQREAVMWCFENVPGLIHADGDPGGLQGAHLEGWRELLGIPIDDADKAAKWTWIELFNNDGELGRIRMREGEVHLHEMQHLTFSFQGASRRKVENDNRVLPDGTIPGRDCCDGGLYSFRRFVNRSREDYTPPPKPGTPEWFATEEKRMREDVDAATELARTEGELSADWTSWYD